MAGAMHTQGGFLKFTLRHLSNKKGRESILAVAGPVLWPAASCTTKKHTEKNVLKT